MPASNTYRNETNKEVNKEVKKQVNKVHLMKERIIERGKGAREKA